MSDVFISYCRSDRDGLAPIIDALGQHDLRYWLDESSILPAMEFNDEILAGLHACPWFLLAMTPRSAVSEYVKDELHWALSNRSGRIIPVMLEACDPALFHLRLLRIQYVNCTGKKADLSGNLGKTLESVRSANAEQLLTLEHQSLSGDLETMSLLLTFISRHHQKHLLNLSRNSNLSKDAELERLAYRGGRSVRHELRDLCAWGLIERLAGAQIGRSAGDGQRFMLNELVKLTPLGQRLAQHVR